MVDGAVAFHCETLGVLPAGAHMAAALPDARGILLGAPSRRAESHAGRDGPQGVLEKSLSFGFADRL